MCDIAAGSKHCRDERTFQSSIIQPIINILELGQGEGEAIVWDRTTDYEERSRLSQEVGSWYFTESIGGAFYASRKLLDALDRLKYGYETNYELICPRTGKKYLALINQENLAAIEAYSKTMYTDTSYANMFTADPRSAALSAFGVLFEPI